MRTDQMINYILFKACTSCCASESQGFPMADKQIWTFLHLASMLPLQELSKHTVNEREVICLTKPFLTAFPLIVPCLDCWVYFPIVKPTKRPRHYLLTVRYGLRWNATPDKYASSLRDSAHPAGTNVTVDQPFIAAFQAITAIPPGSLPLNSCCRA